ncbi:MAG TPA: serine/threonine-protein kinase, partial [Kofleriaceae bacterium]
MGRVDDAFDTALDRPVAIKHMLSASPIDLARFEREAKITARLEHPGIVPIHDAGRTPDGTPYYVMRRVDGQPLDQRVTKDLKERLALIPNILAACDAVAFAHARNVIHRDIKPTNILVGPFGETLVIDWGLAREIGMTDEVGSALPSTDQNLTRVGTVAGTPGFMSPEQARGEQVDTRADVFALGATLYFVLTGALPYGTASATEMIGLAGAGRSADWLKVPAAVPADLVAIARKAMAPEPVDRYRDAGELAADLRRFITGNLVGAYAYSTAARFARFAKKHRAALAVGLVAMLVVIVGGVVSVRRVLAERDTAEGQRAIAEQQREEAESSSDLLRIQHALELSESDPVSAISVLRTLPVTSKRWAAARVAAQSAFVKGIPFGFRGPQLAS